MFGRRLGVRRASPCGGGAWFDFAELCAAPLGPADYTAVAGRFHTVFVEGVPAMSMQVRAWAFGCGGACGRVCVCVLKKNQKPGVCVCVFGVCVFGGGGVGGA